LSKGVNSVSWLPSVHDSKPQVISGVKDGNEILPLFPLGGIVYTPNSEHVLNIFEPRYRQMYNDILMNGSKRFVVSMSHPSVKGSFAKVGVLFQLEDLKEVSEQTQDQIKYICNHKVIGRVNIDKVLNPDVWTSRETYLKVEGTIIDDSKDDEIDASSDVYVAVAAAKLSTEEQRLKNAFACLVDMQHELQEDVRFTKASVDSFAVKPGSGEDGLWQTIRLWQSYTEQRLVNRQNEMQKEFQNKLIEFLKREKGVKDEELPSAIGFTDLSPALQKEVSELQRRMAVELQPLVLESTLTMQKILEAKGHAERVELVRFFINAEQKRLEAKKTLRGMFSSDISSPDNEIATPVVKDDPAESPPSSNIKDDEDESDSTPMQSIFTDDPDAFQ